MLEEYKVLLYYWLLGTNAPDVNNKNKLHCSTWWWQITKSCLKIYDIKIDLTKYNIDNVPDLKNTISRWNNFVVFCGQP
jgi:hypothetical protein